MYDVVLLSLASDRDAAPGGCGGTACGAGCAGRAAESGTATPGTEAGAGCAESPRVPVLACADALTKAGARVELVVARSDAEIDSVLARLDGPPRSDGLTWPDTDGKTRLIVAAADNAQLRAVVRRMVRRYAPPPSRRPSDLPDNRTLPDLPPIGVLPLDPIRANAEPADLAAQLGLPREPAAVAAAVLAGHARRFDLLRNDGGSVTLDSALIGGADEAGKPLAWRGRVEVDGNVLTAGDDPVLACVVANAGGYAVLEGVPLLDAPDPGDGVVEVAVAVPVTVRTRWRRSRVRLEVRRARGRAVAVSPRDVAVPFVDDAVTGELGRKRSWWVEPGAWAAYTG